MGRLPLLGTGAPVAACKRARPDGDKGRCSLSTHTLGVEGQAAHKRCIRVSSIMRWNQFSPDELS